MNAGVGPTLDQRRAKHAWEAVSRIKNSSPGAKPNSLQGPTYAREAKRLSVRILTAGLGHALAFLLAKSKPNDENALLLRDIGDWVLAKRNSPDGSNSHPARDALICAVVHRDAAFLRLATDESLAYLQWLTRFAEAEFGTEDN